MNLRQRAVRRLRSLAIVGPAVALLLGGCGGGAPSCTDEARSNGTCVRVLFIGNSYTYVNDLPREVAELGAASGRQVETTAIASAGSTLADAVETKSTMAVIASGDWTVVVIQEQSQIPASPAARRYGMYPAVRKLVGAIKGSGARPILFETWAHRDGWREQGLTTYAAMQRAIREGYEEINREVTAAVAPVGDAWAIARRERPALALWQADGTHPSAAGTYLAACVFYRVIFGASPEGLSYHGGLADDDAAALQRIAAGAVS